MVSMETNETNKLKANFFKNKNLSVHITKSNGWFHNGIIKEVLNDHLILNDERDGDTPIFLMEIIEIEERRVRE